MTPLPTPLLARPRLSAIDPQRRIVVVTALPGSGKSALIDQVMAATGARATFEIQLARDRLQVAVAGPDELIDLVRVVHAKGVVGPDDPDLLAAVAVAMERGDEVAMTTDGFTQRDPDYQGWARDVLTSLADAGLTMLFASRMRPTWPLATWRVEGRLRVLDDRDLAFTLEEAVDAVLGPEAGVPVPGWLEELHGRTQGWATAVAAARTLARTNPDGPDRRALDRLVEDLGDHMAAQVLADTDDEDRATLSLASVAPEMSADLADAIGPAGSGGRLIALARSQPALVPDDDAPDWYRLHPLLAAGLRRDTDRHGDVSVAEFAERVAAWHRREGRIVSAIEMLLEGRRWEAAMDALMAASLDFAEANDQAGFLALVDRIPTAVWGADARMALHVAILASSAGREELSEAVLSRPPLTHHDLPPATAAVADVMRSWAISYSGPATVCLAAAERALDVLPRVAEADLPVVTEIRARRPYEHIATIAAGRAETDLYRWDAAKARLRAAAHDPEVSFLVRLNARSALAWVKARRGDIAEALRTAAEAQDVATASGVADSQALAEANLAVAAVACWQLDHAGARVALDAAERQATRHQAHLPLAWVTIMRALVSLREGDPDAAIVQLDRGVRRATGAAHTAATAVRIRALMRTGDPATARALARDLEVGPDTVVAMAETVIPGAPIDVSRDAWAVPDWPSARLVAAVAEAIATAGRGESPAEALSDALAIARSTDLWGPFGEVGSGLLATAAEAPEVAELVREVEARWARSLDGSAGPDGGAVGSIGQIARLTPREIEVLRHLAEPVTMLEVANSLFLSPNTLKTHARRIYRKLGVVSRAGAVSAARRRGVV